MPRPPLAEYEGLRDWLESGDRSRRPATRPTPGSVVLHRLNRTEYANADSRSARPANRCDHAAAAGRFGQRLRQHRRVADDLADAARVVRDGGGARGPHGGRLLEVADRGHLPGVERRVAEPSPRRDALRHARRHRRPPRLSRPTANTSSRFRTSASAASFPASSWRSSSTASARTSGRTAVSASAVGMTADSRRHAGGHGAGPGRLAPGRRDVHRHELPPEPRHHPAVRSEVAREQHHPAAAELPGDRLRPHPGPVQRAASARLGEPAQGLHLPPVAGASAGGALRATDPDDARAPRLSPSADARRRSRR